MKQQRNKEKNLKNLKVKNLTEQELLKIDGGSWLDKLLEGYKRKFKIYATSERKTYIS